MRSDILRAALIMILLGLVILSTVVLASQPADEKFLIEVESRN